MLGVTVGHGPGWAELAGHACARMARWTGLRCEVMPEEAVAGFAHPSHAKLGIFDVYPGEDAILFFDADILCARAWDPVRILEGSGGFVVVRDESWHPAIRMECIRHNLDPERYFNAGLFLIRRERAGILTRAAGLLPRGVAHYPIPDALEGEFQIINVLEQTALNAAAIREEVGYLPRLFNRLHRATDLPHAHAVNLHLCDWPLEHKLAFAALAG